MKETVTLGIALIVGFGLSLSGVMVEHFVGTIPGIIMRILGWIIFFTISLISVIREIRKR